MKLEMIQQKGDFSRKNTQQFHSLGTKEEAMANAGPYPFDLYLLAGRHDTPTYLLSDLASSSIESIRGRVAENPATPPEILAFLTSDTSVKVKRHLVDNPNAPKIVSQTLARDENADVRYALAESPHVDPQILCDLAKDTNPYVAHRAQKTLDRLSYEVAS